MKYSVIMGCLNKQSFLAEAVDSILEQEEKDWELVIVDDGSTDHSIELLDYYSKKDSRVKVHYNAVNEGISKTYNKATRLAKGDIIVVAAADDVYTKERLRFIGEFFEKYPDRDVVYYPFYKADYGLTPFEIRVADPFEAERLKLPSGQFIGHGFSAYKRKVGDLVPYREKLKQGCDHAFFLDVWKAGFKFGWEPDEKKISGTYRFYLKMVSQMYRPLIVEQDKKIFDEFKDVKMEVDKWLPSK